MELLFVFFYQILVGVIFLINFIKCGEPYCETLTAGKLCIDIKLVARP